MDRKTLRHATIGVLVLMVLSACSSGSNTAATVTTSTTVTTSSAPSTSAAASSAPSSSAPSTSLLSSTAPASTVPTPTVPTQTTPSETTLSTPPTTRKTTSSSSSASTSAATTSCAERTLAGLTQSQRIGQLLMVGIDSTDLTSGAAALRATPVGGVFLSGRWTGGATELTAGIAAVRQAITPVAGVRPHVAVDQEGGYVQGLRGPDFPPIPTAVEQGEESSPELARETAQWASLLVQAGITLDLAPVADVVPAGTAADNPPIGAQDRQYGSTADSVSDSVVAVVQAMLGEKLGTTVKHFPGLGRVAVNTDTSADAVDDQTSATDDALDPFRAAIKAGTTAVMISSARYPQLDPDDIAAFSSPIITGLLRGRLGFDGLIISDDLGGAVAVSDVSIGRRAVEFVRAGGDMVLTVKPSDLAPMTAALTAQAQASGSFRAMVDAAALHVLASKESLGLLTCD